MPLKVPTTKERPVVNLNSLQVLAVSQNHWAKGMTLPEALNGLKKYARKMPKQYSVYVVHPATYVDDIGNLVFPANYPPKLIQEKK